MAHETPRSEAPTVTPDLAPSIHILQKKTLAKNHVVVGEDEAQIVFLEQHLSALNKRNPGSITRSTVDRVTDDMLVGLDGQLFHVTMKHKIDLSPEVRSRTGIWSAYPIVKGSAAINALVKHAHLLLEGSDKVKLKRETLDHVGDEITGKPIVSIRAAICQAMTLLASPIEPWEKWKDPWDHPVEWLRYGMNVEQRLHALYNKLVRYTSLTVYGADAAAKAGASPAQQQHFKTLTLDPTKVYKTISLLAQWRQGRGEPYLCAIQIAAVWA